MSNIVASHVSSLLARSHSHTPTLATAVASDRRSVSDSFSASEALSWASVRLRSLISFCNWLFADSAASASSCWCSDPSINASFMTRVFSSIFALSVTELDESAGRLFPVPDVGFAAIISLYLIAFGSGAASFSCALRGPVCWGIPVINPL